MRAAADLESYLREPFGCYFSGKYFLHFFVDPELCGTIFWGQPDTACVTLFSRAVQVELAWRSPPHVTLVDVRRVTGIDPLAFEALSGFLGETAEEFGRHTLKEAVLRPSGVVGALVAGFYDVTRTAYPERIGLFLDARDAFAWLGRSEADAAQLIAALDAAQLEASGGSELVRELHDYVAKNPRGLTIAGTARAMALAPRTLQIELRRAGTSFRREVNTARVRAAKAYLAGSETKLSAIAHEVGCASLQHFSTLFRRETGLAPKEWRERHRGR